MTLETLVEKLQNRWQGWFETITSWVSSADTYYQLAAIFLAMGLAYGVAHLVRQRIPSLKESDKPSKQHRRKWLVQRAGRLIYPTLVIAFLAVLEALGRDVFEYTTFIHAAQRVAAVWILWVALRAFVTNTLVRAVGLWILVPSALLQLFGIFEPVVEALDSYGFSFGEIEITAYTVLKGIFFVIIVLWVGRILSQTAEDSIRGNRGLTRATKELLVKIINIALYGVLFLVTLDLVGIDLTALAVFGGAVGVGLGFGLQKIASNFISGLILLSEKSITINNLVEMDDGVLGYVRKLGARASIIETFDGKEVMIPNEDFITSRVANLTHNSNKGRVDVPVGVSYNSDLNLVRDLILEAATSYEHTSTEEGYTPHVFLREYGDSSVNFLLVFWLDDVNFGKWGAQSDVMFRIWNSFKAHDIEIPFPQRDVHIRSGLEPMARAKAPKGADEPTSEKTNT